MNPPPAPCAGEFSAGGESRWLLWRIVGTLGVLLAVSAARAETVPLLESMQNGDCNQIRLEMKLAGQMKVQRGGEAAALNLSASATHEFPERVLTIGASGMPEKVASPVCRTAQATIAVAGERFDAHRLLRPDRRLWCAWRSGARTSCSSTAPPPP